MIKMGKDLEGKFIRKGIQKHVLHSSRALQHNLDQILRLPPHQQRSISRGRHARLDSLHTALCADS